MAVWVSAPADARATRSPPPASHAPLPLHATPRHPPPRSVFTKAVRDDLRATRSWLETAAAEENKQQVEMALNPNVLALCVEQARRLKDGAVALADEELAALMTSADGARARFVAAVAEQTSAETGDLQLAVANGSAAAAELSERVRSRREDELTATTHRERLAKEFADMKGTMSKFKDTESEQAAMLAREVRELEEAAAARLANESSALDNEVRAIRAVCAAEAEVSVVFVLCVCARARARVRARILWGVARRAVRDVAHALTARPAPRPRPSFL
jgi:hypothetical protein